MSLEVFPVKATRKQGKFDLYNEIKKGRLRAAFDVYWEEPYKGKLIEFVPDKFFMSPHIASTCSGFLEGCKEGLDDLIRKLSND